MVRTEIVSKKCTNDNSHDIQKLLVLHSECEKPIIKMSAILVSKELEGHIGNNFEAKKMFNGDLIV